MGSDVTLLRPEVLKIGRLSSGLFTYFAVEGGFDMTPFLAVGNMSARCLGGADGSGNALALVTVIQGDQPIKATSINPTTLSRIKHR